jgi:hypothetical protein
MHEGSRGLRDTEPFRPARMDHCDRASSLRRVYARAVPSDGELEVTVADAIADTQPSVTMRNTIGADIRPDLMLA